MVSEQGGGVRDPCYRLIRVNQLLLRSSSADSALRYGVRVSVQMWRPQLPSIGRRTALSREQPWIRSTRVDEGRHCWNLPARKMKTRTIVGEGREKSLLGGPG